MKLLSLKHYHVGTMKNAGVKDKLKKMVHCLVPDSINKMLFKHYFKKLADTNGLEESCLTSYDFLPIDGFHENDWFAKSIEVPFEDVKMPCPVGYDSYLRRYYRDYMVIPENKAKHSDDPNVLIKFDECYEKYWS